MKKLVFTLLAKINKIILPSYSKKGLDLSKASKLQMAVIGWRYLVTTNAINQ
ncbi:SsrA-binding protein [Costertonia aggregata]|uniref:SsrA-binding protein n=1 Tax=Costertonia aggregata TaxID=343403 RepID=A0A7H9AS44_9FLAO|nr:SsrA-binding protein [Costertonia aggregata]QLG46227.1 SsrA-binding protein [Costertonia aggregata]